MTKERLYSLDMMKCMAAIFITNSHFQPLYEGGDCPKTHKLESVNFQFATDDSTFSQLRSCFDFVCRIIQQYHDTTVSD